MNKALLVFAVVLCFGTAWAGNVSDNAVPFKANARVVVDENGVPTQVEASQKLPEPIRRAVEARVAQWRFQPLVVDGQPRTGTTHVFLDACAVQQQDGELNIAMDYLWNGPGYVDGELRHPVPAYPAEAARGGNEGSFRVIVKIGADGVATVESIERQKGVLKLFEPTLRAWATAFRYVPEEIDGVPVETRIAMPVDFTIYGPNPPRTERARRIAAVQSSSTCATASQGGTRTNPVVLDSPFKLLGTEG